MNNNLNALIDRLAADNLGCYDGGPGFSLSEEHYAATPTELLAFVGLVLNELAAQAAARSNPPIEGGPRLSMEDCIAQFRMYAGVNPNPDAQHALVFAADFLRDHGPEPTVQNPHSAGDQNGYWLVELRPAFDGHPAFDPTYYAGWMDGPSDAAKTHDVHASAKFTSKEAAQQVAAKLGHTLSCAWEAVEHKCEADRSPERDAAAVRAWAIENFSPDVMDVAVDAYNAGTVGAAKTAFKRTQ